MSEHTLYQKHGSVVALTRCGLSETDKAGRCEAGDSTEVIRGVLLSFHSTSQARRQDTQGLAGCSARLALDAALSGWLHSKGHEKQRSRRRWTPFRRWNDIDNPVEGWWSDVGRRVGTTEVSKLAAMVRYLVYV